ncbi:MAG: hypothetical protein ACE5Q6_08715, partial [Dehalococcoidia bacterium]
RREKPSLQGATIEELAALKALPLTHLRDFLNWEDVDYFGTPAIAIPYPDEHNGDVMVRYRVGLDSDDRFRWKRFLPGQTTRLYGLWSLDFIDEMGFCVWVEGETDYAALSYHQYPCLAVPGVSNYRSAMGNVVKQVPWHYIWKEPGKAGEEFVERIARDFPNARVIAPPPGIKDPCELAQVLGDRFRETMEQLLDQAQPVRPSYDELEIGTCFIPSAKVGFLGPGYGEVITEHLNRLKDLLIQAYEAEAEWDQMEKVANCFESYAAYRCARTSKVFLRRFRCGDLNCPVCAFWMVEHFFTEQRGTPENPLPAREEILKRALGQPVVYRIHLFSEKLPHDLVKRENAIRQAQKRIVQMNKRLTDNYGKDHSTAKDHCRGLRLKIEGDVIHFEQIILANYEAPGRQLLEQHFRKETGVDSQITMIECHGFNHARETFIGLMAVRIDWDVLENYQVCRAALRGSKLIQGKGAFHKCTGGKPRKRPQHKESMCQVCFECEPTQLPGFYPVKTTRVKEAPSIKKGRTYLELADDTI